MSLVSYIIWYHTVGIIQYQILVFHTLIGSFYIYFFNVSSFFLLFMS